MSRRPYGRWNRIQGALVPGVKPDEHRTEKKFGLQQIPTKCLLPGYMLSKLLVAMELKGQRHVRQKQHRAGAILALSSPFVNRET